MKVITITNGKGGVGKTTLAQQITAELAHRGDRVLAIDTDPQANLTTGFRLKEAPGVYDLVVRNAGWQSVVKSVHPDIYEGEVGKLKILLGNNETRAIPGQVVNQFVLLKRLSQVQHLFDWVIIDTQPAPTMFIDAIYTATDFVLVPTQMERYSLRQMQKTLGYIENINEWKSAKLGAIRLLGIVPMMYQGNTTTHGGSLEDLAKHYGEDAVWSPIAKRIVWAEACAAQLPVTVYAPKSEAANEVRLMVDRLWEATHVPA